MVGDRRSVPERDRVRSDFIDLRAFPLQNIFTGRTGGRRPRHAKMQLTEAYNLLANSLRLASTNRIGDVASPRAAAAFSVAIRFFAFSPICPTLATHRNDSPCQ